jgi:hypothetical protein
VDFISKDQVFDGSRIVAVFATRYVTGVLGSAITMLKRPLSFMVFLWLLAIIVIRLNHTLRTAFGPLCYLPVISRSAFCRPLPNVDKTPQWADYPSLVNVQSVTMEHLLNEAVGGSALALDIKKAELATRDLTTLVKFSDLERRDELASTLMDFLDHAKKTGRGLHKFSAKVGGAVDS